MVATRLQAHSHPYASRMAMLMQARWQNARTALRHPSAIIKYYSEAHIEELGRGMPFGGELDPTLSIRALSEGMMSMLSHSGPPSAAFPPQWARLGGGAGGGPLRLNRAPNRSAGTLTEDLCCALRGISRREFVLPQR